MKHLYMFLTTIFPITKSGFTPSNSGQERLYGTAVDSIVGIGLSNVRSGSVAGCKTLQVEKRGLALPASGGVPCVCDRPRLEHS